MDEIIKSNRFTTDGVSVSIKICRSESQVLFLKMEQERVGFDKLITSFSVDVLDALLKSCKILVMI